MWQCPACGAAITIERRSAHRKHWCPALDDDDDDAPAPEASRTPAAAAPSLSFATAPASTSTTHARVASIGLDLEFACQSIFGAVSTGGALWRSELVLAEWCARELRLGAIGAHTRAPRVLELGCGVAPAAGMTCLALGASVHFTDLAEVLPFVEANVRLNGDRISTLRARAGHAPLSRSSCDTEAYRFGRQSAASASQSRLASLARAPRGFDLILASDCIFRSDLHTPLAQTLRQLFDYDAAGRGSRPSSQVRCVVAFRYREAADLEFFTDALPREGLVATCLTVTFNLFPFLLLI
jgi:predicted nicotinamide N-methyase